MNRIKKLLKYVIICICFNSITGCTENVHDVNEDYISLVQVDETDIHESTTEISTTELTTNIEIKNDFNEEQKKKIVVIDPGHQKIGNSEQEPIGPGASETKNKVTSGTSGVISGLNEYELNLIIGLKLKEELENKGYTVIMTRETNDVDISNIQRAQIANDLCADAFVRIHANGSDNPNAKGAMTICQTRNNPYNSNVYYESYLLSECVLDSLVESTGAYKEKIWETDTMSGINWSNVPTTIIEVGYMTNIHEDRLLSTEDYQNKIAIGISNGIDKFLKLDL